MKILSKRPFGYKKMAGLTLLETMFAIALGVLVLIGAVVFFSSGKQSTSASKTVADMNSITAGYQSYIATGQALPTETTSSPTGPVGSMTGTYKTVQAAGFLPSSLTDAVGQPYTVQYTGSTLVITVKGITYNNSLCTSISSMLVSTGNNITSTSGDCTATMNL